MEQKRNPFIIRGKKDFSEERSELRGFLFKKIIEEFLYQDFTLSDIQETFSDLAGIKDFNKRAEAYDGKKPNRNNHPYLRKGNNYNKSDLDYFVKKGWLDFDEETKIYAVNHNSSYITRIMTKIRN